MLATGLGTVQVEVVTQHPSENSTPENHAPTPTHTSNPTPAAREPIRPHFAWKLYVIMTVLLLVSLSVVGIRVARHEETAALAQAQTQLRHEALLFAQLAETSLLPRSDSASLHKQVEAISQTTGTRYTLVSSDGRVLLDSHVDASKMDDHSKRPEILAAQRGQYGSAIRWSDTLGHESMYVAVQVVAGELSPGYARTAVPLTDVKNRIHALRRLVAGIAAGALLVALSLGLLAARWMAQPLTAMAETAQAIAAGDLNRRVEVSKAGELGVLGSSINLMAQRLGERLRRITGERNELAAILSGMIEGVVAADREGRVLYLNTVASEMTQVDKDALAKHGYPTGGTVLFGRATPVAATQATLWCAASRK